LYALSLSFSLLKGRPKNNGGCVVIDWRGERERERERRGRVKL